MRYLGEIKKLRETGEGTEMIVKVPGALLADTVERYKQNGVELSLGDGRKITPDQRKRYYATLKDIADHTGNIPEDMHSYFKLQYMYKVEDKYISMSNCTVTEAKEMISLLIDFVLANDIPLSDKAINRAEDVGRYLYGCVINRRCACCGKLAEIHHVSGSRIGMGGDRKSVAQVGREVVALCRQHHNQAHQEGEEEFFKVNKIWPIKLDEVAVKKLKL